MRSSSSALDDADAVAAHAGARHAADAGRRLGAAPRASTPDATTTRSSVTLPAGRITGLRLEALPDPSLPKGGPGRDHYGNFVLTGFAVDRLDESGAATPLDVRTTPRRRPQRRRREGADPARRRARTLTRGAPAAGPSTRPATTRGVPRQVVFVLRHSRWSSTGRHGCS